MIEDFASCYRAVQAKDPRFDGWFVTAVLTTKIYCRPSCPARSPFAANVRFLPTAAAAQLAGFRACKRCRPDASPGSPEWSVRGDVVARAMRLIADGVVEREGVDGLAAHLHYSTRQIERHLVSELGAGPLALARAQRAQAARVLIETTDLALGDVAFGAGFNSVRQFNDTVRAVFAMTPRELRGRSRTRPVETATGAGTLNLRLPVRTPFSFASLFGHLVATAVPGCEEYRDGAYRRTLRLAHGNGIVALTPATDHVRASLQLDDLRDLAAAVARCRRMLDLDADPVAVVEALGEDPRLRAAVRAAPGRRIPGTVDEHEFAVRVVLGQQVSVAAARTHAARLVAAGGATVADPRGGLTHLFPTAAELATLDPARWRLPTARRRCLRELVTAVASGQLALGAGVDRDEARARLNAIPGVGPWTTEMIAMRALGDPDAFPASDMGVQKGATGLGLPTGVAALERHARSWRPWRSYAVTYLWAATDHAVNQFPPKGPT